MADTTVTTDTTTTAAPATTAAVDTNNAAGQDTTDTGASTPPAAKASGADDQQKPEGATAPEGEQKLDATAKPQLPDTYEFTMPEGVALDTELSAELGTIAKEYGLTQEQAQKVADLGVKQAQKFATQFQTSQATQHAQWAEAAKTDKEYGGDAFEANLGTANKFLGGFATPEFKQLLIDTGLGNHPEMIRMMVRAGKAITQDNFVVGGNAQSKGGRTAAQTLYPDQKSST